MKHVISNPTGVGGKLVSSLLVVGLGNPMKTYHGDRPIRHNLGFAFLDHFVRAEGINTAGNYEFLKNRCRNADIIESSPFILAKPTSYMNLSGGPVKTLLNQYKLTPDQLVVVYDDMERAFGKVHLKESGSASGHNGIRHIIDQLGTDKFKRICIGIGKPAEKSLIQNFVLSAVTDEERSILYKTSFPGCVEMIYKIHSQMYGIQTVLNKNLSTDLNSKIADQDLVKARNELYKEKMAKQKSERKMMDKMVKRELFRADQHPLKKH